MAEAASELLPTVNIATLGAVTVAGLVAGRLAAAIAERYQPRRRVRWPGRWSGCFGVPVTEVATAALWLAVVYRFGMGWAALPPLVAATSLVALSVIDLRVYRLPDAVTLPAFVASLVAVVTASAALGRPDAIISALMVALGYGALMWVAHEIQPSGLGFGDVKIAPLLGLHIGWVAGAVHSGWPPAVSLALQALLFGCLIGIVMGLALAMLRRFGTEVLNDPMPAGTHPRSRPGGSRLLDTSFPFGPALATGTMIVVMFSESLAT